MTDELKLPLNGTLATDKFDEAMRTVTQDRGKDYGHPLDAFRRMQALQEIVAECPDPQVRHALGMICVKIARLVEAPGHLDSIIDIGGYARTIAMIHDERKRRSGLKEELATRPGYLTRISEPQAGSMSIVST